MKKVNYLEEVHKSKTYLERTQKLKKFIKLAKGKELKLLKEEQNRIKSYAVGLLEKVKNGEEFAFDELLEVKDIRNFMYHYSYHIRKYHKFRYSEEHVLSEMRFQIFYHVKQNYRIYNEPHEFSLLIGSMRNWIKPKISEGLRTVYKPKDDDYLYEFNLEGTNYDESEVIVRDFMNRYMTDEEQEIFEMRFFKQMNLVDIGNVIGKNKDTVSRRYEKILNKLKYELEEIYFG